MHGVAVFICLGCVRAYRAAVQERIDGGICCHIHLIVVMYSVDLLSKTAIENFICIVTTLVAFSPREVGELTIQMRKFSEENLQQRNTPTSKYKHMRVYLGMWYVCSSIATAIQHIPNV